MSFFQGKTKNRIERCGKEVSINKEEVWKETNTSRFQKAKYQEEACNEIQEKSCYSKKHQEKTIPKEPKKVEGKCVNSSALSYKETEKETSAETEIYNNSIALSTKESFNEGKKEVNGGVEKQKDDSDLNKQPEKTKDSFSEGEKKVNGHLQTCSKKKTLVKMVDLGANSDCSEPESKSKDESQTEINIEPKVSVQGEIKEKGGVEPPEPSVQPPMTKECDIDIVEQGSSVQQEIKNNQNVEPESSGQQVQQEIKERGEVEQESLVWEEIKEK